jgi:hypothetical protein
MLSDERAEDENQIGSNERLPIPDGFLHESAVDEFAQPLVAFDKPQKIRFRRRPGPRLEQYSVQGHIPKSGEPLSTVGKLPGRVKNRE